MFNCNGCCDCFKKEEEPELDTGYKIDETKQQILVDKKQLKHKFHLKVDKKTYIFYMTDKALKQLYEKKQKFLEDIKEGEKNFYNFSIDCFALGNDKFIILSEDDDYLKKTNNRLSVYCNNSHEKFYLLEIKKIKDDKKIEKIDIDLEKDFFEELISSNIDSSYSKLGNENEKIDHYNGEEEISLYIKEERSKPTEEKIDVFNAKPGEKQSLFGDLKLPKGKLMDWSEKKEEDNFNDNLNKEYKFRLHFDDDNGVDLDFIFNPECLLSLYIKIMFNKNFNKSGNKYVVLGLSGADIKNMYSDEQKYVIDSFVEWIIGDDGEGYYNLPTPWLAIFFDDFGRISGIKKISSEGFLQEFNDIKTGDVEYLSRFIKEKGEELYNGHKIIIDLQRNLQSVFSCCCSVKQEEGNLNLDDFLKQNSNNNNSNAENNLNKNIPQLSNGSGS